MSARETEPIADHSKSSNGFNDKVRQSKSTHLHQEYQSLGRVQSPITGRGRYQRSDGLELQSSKD